jgi:hypothetical protein
MKIKAGKMGFMYQKLQTERTFRHFNPSSVFYFASDEFFPMTKDGHFVSFGTDVKVGINKKLLTVVYEKKSIN